MSVALFLKNENQSRTLVKSIEFQLNYLTLEIITAKENNGINYVILSIDYNNSILYHYKFEYSCASIINLLINDLIEFDNTKYYYKMPIADFRNYIVRLSNKYKNSDAILITDIFKYN